jgi:hypothetical protein
MPAVASLPTRRSLPVRASSPVTAVRRGASAHGDRFVPGSLAEQAGAETGREVQALAQCALCGLAGAGAAAEGAELEPLALGGAATSSTRERTHPTDGRHPCEAIEAETMAPFVGRVSPPQGRAVVGVEAAACRASIWARRSSASAARVGGGASASNRSSSRRAVS